MGYAILRAKKLKTLASIRGSGRHTFREIPTPNADGTANCQVCGAASAAELVAAVRGSLPRARRKDAVLCIEYLVSASPSAFCRHGGAMPDIGGYFDRAMDWLRARHGLSNIVCAVVHLDERTPHLIAYLWG